MYKLVLRLTLCLFLCFKTTAAIADETQQEPLPSNSVFGFVETQFWITDIPAIGTVGTSVSKSTAIEYSLLYVDLKRLDRDKSIKSIHHTARVRYFPSSSMTFNISTGWSLVSNKYAFKPDGTYPSKFSAYKLKDLKTGPELAVGNWWQWGRFSLRFDWIGATMMFGIKHPGSEEKRKHVTHQTKTYYAPTDGINLILGRSGIGVSL